MANNHEKLVRELTTYSGAKVRYYDFDDVRCFDKEEYEKAIKADLSLAHSVADEKDMNVIEETNLINEVHRMYDSDWNEITELIETRVYDFSKIEWDKWSSTRIYLEFVGKSKKSLRGRVILYGLSSLSFKLMHSPPCHCHLESMVFIASSGPNPIQR